MKLYKWLYGAMALTILGACSDRDFLPEENPDNIQATQGEADGYIAIRINLPQETGTRADGDETPETPTTPEDTGAKNDQYGDGTSAEYHVDNAIIALFMGDNENTAKFYRAQKLTKPFFNTLPEDDGVSASYIAAIEAKRPENSQDKYWALVILNANESTTGFITKEGKEVFSIGNLDLVPESTPFSAVKNVVTEQTFISKNDKGEDRFFMINAPMSDKIGTESGITAANIHYMTALDTEVYDTPDKAKNNVAGCVYVERAMAKVTCQGFSKDRIQFTLMKDDINTYEDNQTSNEATDLKDWTVEAEVTYALSNTPTQSFIIRNVDFSADSHFKWDLTNPTNNRTRMIGTDPIGAFDEPFHSSVQKLYRTYWCRDPHYYGVDAEELTEAKKTMVDASTEFKTLDKTTYCKENTFQVVNQNYANSTLAVFKVTYNIKSPNNGKAKNLYIRDGNHKSVYVTPETAYFDGIIRITKDLHVQDAIKAAVAEGKTLPEKFSVLNHLDIKFGETGEEGEPKYLTIEDIKLKKGKNEDFFDENSEENFNKALESYKDRLLQKVNQLTDVMIFDGCVAYYTVPIKHFGDYYTPWDKKITGTDTEDVYNEGKSDWNNSTHAEKYLGRYGIVRNNWYDLNISKITGLESPIIPDTDISKSDDNNDNTKYFSVEIHILSWAKRVQDIEL